MKTSFLDENYNHFFKKVVGRNESELLSDASISKFFKSSKIMIIGAGGSIGSALAIRLAQAGIANVSYFDRDESSLHALSLLLSNKSASHSSDYFVGDIRDSQSVSEAIQFAKPTVVIHAAALKHLVILERFPREGYLTNLIGTKNVAETCRINNVEKFVNISTDKAANPISILGKTKKLAELIVEEVFSDSNLGHCSVRFGNVFASRGSVIETFIHQLNNSEKVTITDPSAARFFMSKNEAANLILASATLESSGTYIQDMGEQVKIANIVERIASYLGVQPEIEFIGLQKGEKKYEELYDGSTTPTIYKSISKSLHNFAPGLLEELHSLNVRDNNEALLVIERLTAKYIEKSSTLLDSPE